MMYTPTTRFGATKHIHHYLINATISNQTYLYSEGLWNHYDSMLDLFVTPCNLLTHDITSAHLLS